MEAKIQWECSVAHIADGLDSKTLKRFWDKVDVRSDNECWNWTAGRFKEGYGCFSINKKSFGAHRVSCIIHYGFRDAHLYAIHKCDNPLCVNPNHLRWGTPAENSLDMVVKKRSLRGASHPNASISKEMFDNISVMINEELSNMQISRITGISNQSISNIRTGKHFYCRS